MVGPARAATRPRRRQRAPARDVPRLPHGMVQQWAVRFDATGSGYAKMWLGHVLLLVLTLGLAWPWTHRRTQRYFMRHTEVAGHRLDFYLPNRLLLPRLGMTAALWLGLVGASMGSFWTGMAAMTMTALIWPLLVYLQVNHQVGAVTWAGRSLWFDGPWSDLYRVSGMPLVLFLGGSWAMALASHQGLAHAGGVAAALLGLGLLCLPLTAWAFYRYRQQHIRLGPLRLRWKASRRDLWLTLGRSAAWAGMWAVLALCGMAVVLAAWGSWQGTLHRQAVAGALGVAAAVVLTLWVAELDAALLDAVWNHTGNRHLRFRTDLKRSAYARLFGRNALRVALTLGLYWPWAVVSVRRMRWQAMSVWSRVDAEVLMAYWLPETDPETVQSESSSAGRADGFSTQPSFASRYGTLD